MYIGTPKFTNDGTKTSRASAAYLALECMFTFKLGGKNISIQNSSNTVAVVLDREIHIISFINTLSNIVIKTVQVSVTMTNKDFIFFPNGEKCMEMNHVGLR